MKGVQSVFSIQTASKRKLSPVNMLQIRIIALCVESVVSLQRSDTPTHFYALCSWSFQYFFWDSAARRGAAKPVQILDKPKMSVCFLLVHFS